MHLCALCALAPHLDLRNAAELFDACKGKTRRQVEQLLAARFPRPDVREQIRRLPAVIPAPVEAAPCITAPSDAAGVDSSARNSPTKAACVTAPSDAADVDSSVRNLPTTRTADERHVSRVPAELPKTSPDTVPQPAALSTREIRRRSREFEPLSADRYGVHFTADAELHALIERARALASHRLPNGDLAGLVKLMATTFVRQEEKRRFGIGAKRRRPKTETTTETETATESESERCGERGTPPGGASVPPSASKPAAREPRSRTAETTDQRGRYVPATVRREIHERDGGQCAFVSADGRRCKARAFLELDHREPLARGGAPDAQNMRLLCRAHNLSHARSCFGALHIAAKIAARTRPGAAGSGRRLSSRPRHSSRAYSAPARTAKGRPRATITSGTQQAASSKMLKIRGSEEISERRSKEPRGLPSAAGEG